MACGFPWFFQTRFLGHIIVLYCVFCTIGDANVSPIFNLAIKTKPFFPSIKWIDLSEMTDSICHFHHIENTTIRVAVVAKRLRTLSMLGDWWFFKWYERDTFYKKKWKTAYKLKINQSINDEIEIDSYKFYTHSQMYTCSDRTYANKRSITALKRLQRLEKKMLKLICIIFNT